MLAPSYDPLWLVPLSVFAGGLLGSPHCLSMCGPLVLNFAKDRSSLVAYQLARMVAYCVVGALVGVFGQSVLGSDRPTWLSGVSLLFIAALLIFNGFRALRGLSFHLPIPPEFYRFLLNIWKKLGLLRWPPTAMAGLAGGLTVFMPCGHLYSFLVGAVATGSAPRGALFMFAFWLGSAPLLMAGPGWLQKVFRSRTPGGPHWAGMMLVMAGLFSVAAFGLRTEYFQQSMTKVPAEAPVICH